ncbi:MAG: hypothetical protein KME47_05310 [Nodosilinea sp. WJT8-NPBG4]|nr:hypothetical protein [Nodosilinea sp. WJT8-NPBG4]
MEIKQSCHWRGATLRPQVSEKPVLETVVDKIGSWSDGQRPTLTGHRDRFPH